MLEFYSFGLTPDLKHYNSRGCSMYNEFCPVLTGKEEDASADGIKAKDACCGCGGGIRAGQCEAIGYKQDDGLGKACEASGYEQEDLAAQLAQLKEEALENTRQLAKLRTQQDQTNELLTQLAASAEERLSLLEREGGAHARQGGRGRWSPTCRWPSWTAGRAR